MEGPEIVIGVDPGTARTGYGVLAVEDGNMQALDFGCITTTPKQTREQRLKTLYLGISAVLTRTRPHIVVVEQLFFNRNVTTAMAVGEARGVILLAVAEHGARLSEYNAVQVKEALTGYGSASKDQVRQIVMMHLNLDTPPSPDDVSDALAIALCYLYRRDMDT